MYAVNFDFKRNKLENNNKSAFYLVEPGVNKIVNLKTIIKLLLGFMPTVVRQDYLPTFYLN